VRRRPDADSAIQPRFSQARPDYGVDPARAEDVVLFVKRDDELERVRSVSGAYFVRLHGKYAFP
jgi:hypothetical protein